MRCFISILVLATYLLTGCNSSDRLANSEYETELARIRAEIRQIETKVETELTDAKVRLTIAEKELETAKTTNRLLTGANLPPIQQHDPSWNPEQVLKAYLKAPSLEHRLAFVRDAAKVQPLMNSHYNSRYAPMAGFTIHPHTGHDIAIGKSIIVTVEKANQLPVEYVIHRSPDGCRVDWVASRAKWLTAEEKAFRKAHGLVNAMLEIELVKRKLSGELTFKITNRSDAIITSGTLKCHAFGKGKKYLDSGIVFLEEISAGKSKIYTVYLTDAKSSQLDSWQFDLEGVTIGIGNGTSESVVKYFALKQVDS